MRNRYTSIILALGALAACSSSDETQLFTPVGQILPETTGRASFAIASNGVEIVSVEYVVTRDASEVLSGEASAPASGAAIEVTLDLRSGDGYRVALTAVTADGRACSGESQVFDIVAGAVVDVHVALVCAPEDRGQAHVTAEVVDPSAAGACDGLGGGCHAVDGGGGAAHECHQLGHAGDVAACAARRAECIDVCGSAQCTALASLCHEVDPGSGPLHECHQLGHAGDAGACFERGAECQELCSRAHAQPVVIQFEARAGDAPLACGQSYAGVGSPPASISLQDLRLFVHDVELITASGARVPVELDTRAPFQALGTSLLDFEDATGDCLSGDSSTNTQVTGSAPPGEYTGLAFVVGVPESVNHVDPALAPAPLGAGGMSWGWLAGYKFLRAEIGGDAGSAALHLGSAGCSGDASQGSIACSRSNRPEVVLAEFAPATDRVILDVAALFADADLSAPAACHSAGASCAAPFARLGLDLTTGASTGTQSVFRVGH
jgi:uncharacterized repeat protein (TIGR04052 family)